MHISKALKLAAVVAMAAALARALRPPHEPPADPSGVREPRRPLIPSGGETGTV